MFCLPLGRERNGKDHHQQDERGGPDEKGKAVAKEGQQRVPSVKLKE
jgi:hypothetical protein